MATTTAPSRLRYFKRTLMLGWLGQVGWAWSTPVPLRDGAMDQTEVTIA